MRKQVKMISIVALVAMLVVSLFGCKKMDSTFLKETVKTMDANKGVSTIEMNIKAQGLNNFVKESVSESEISFNPEFNFDDIIIKVDSQAADQSTVASNVSIKIGEEFVPLTDVILKDSTYYMNIMSISGVLTKILPEQVAPMINMVVAGFGVTAEKPYLSFSADDLSGLANMADMGDETAKMPDMSAENQGKISASLKNLINAIDIALTGVEPEVMGVEEDYYTVKVNADNIGIIIEKFSEVGIANKADLVSIANVISPDSLSEEDIKDVNDEDLKEYVEKAKKAFEETDAFVSSKIKTKGDGESLMFDMEFNMNMNVEEVPVNIFAKVTHNAKGEVNVTVPTGVVTLQEAMTALQTMGGMTDPN